MEKEVAKPQKGEMMKIILHKQIYRPTGFDGEINTTLCGRSGNYMPDWYGNVSDKDSEVTCKLCIKKLKVSGHSPHKKVVHDGKWMEVCIWWEIP